MPQRGTLAEVCVAWSMCSLEVWEEIVNTPRAHGGMGVSVEMLLPVDHHVENSERHSMSSSEGAGGISLVFHGRDQLSNVPFYWLFLLPSFTLPSLSFLIPGITFQINCLRMSPCFRSCI